MNKPPWGRIYGSTDNPDFFTPDGPVNMFRKGQRVRFYNDKGEQIGPEQANIAPAVAYGLTHPDWRAPSIFTRGYCPHTRVVSGDYPWALPDSNIALSAQTGRTDNEA